jgi:hypothetical protein
LLQRGSIATLAAFKDTPMFLFTVNNTFIITGRGLLLTPGPGNKTAKIGSKIKLIRPDKSIIETRIKGIIFEGNHDILIGAGLKKEDVPIGTEVWLSE